MADDHGTSSATAHMAHLICELYLRLKVIGRAEGDTIQLPVTQAESAISWDCRPCT